MLLTSTQVGMAISAGIVFSCTLALFLAGYVLQQQTVRSLQAMIVKPTILPQSRYLDVTNAHISAHIHDLDTDTASLSPQEEISFQKTAELERNRMRRGKAFDGEQRRGYGTNGGKLGGYRSDTTPEHFRKGRKKEISLIPPRGDFRDREDVDSAELLISIDEGGATVAPWADGDGFTDLDRAEEHDAW